MTSGSSPVSFQINLISNTQAGIFPNILGKHITSYKFRFRLVIRRNRFIVILAYNFVSIIINNSDPIRYDLNVICKVYITKLLSKCFSIDKSIYVYVRNRCIKMLINGSL